MTSKRTIRDAAVKYGWRLTETGRHGQLDIFRRPGADVSVEYTHGDKVTYADYRTSGSPDWYRIRGGRAAVIEHLRMFGTK